jgi:hypothetical protein
MNRPSQPIEIPESRMVRATCLVCRREIWCWSDREVCWTPDGTATIAFDREEFRGDELLSLHPCIHEWTADDFDDPDWALVVE